jgi:hypothetical protein
MFPAVVERWRPLVVLEHGTLPADLVLAFMRRESNGTVGDIGGRDDRIGYTDAEIACGFPARFRRRDLGLMQVAPVTLRRYVETTGDRITPCDLAATSTDGARKQIRVGVWALARALESAVDLSPTLRATSTWPKANPPDDQILLARCVYGFGATGTRDRLDAAAAAGYPRTFGGLEAYKPAPARLFEGARAILGWYKSGGGAGAGEQIAPPIATLPRKEGSAAGVLLLGGLLLYSLSRSSSRKEKTS